MSIYNTTIYNTTIYNGKQAVTSLVDAEGIEIVDKWISPLFLRFWPEYFHDYEKMMQMWKYYLEFIESGRKPYWVLSHITELASVENTLDDLLSTLRDQLAPDFNYEEFPDIDIRKFLSNAKRFYAIKGTDQSFRYLFRLIGKEIDIFRPIDDTLFIGEDSVIGNEKLIDSYYFTPYTYDIRVDMAFKKWEKYITDLNHPIATRMFASYIQFLGDSIIPLPSINTTLPNEVDEKVLLENTGMGTIPTTITVTGDLSLFPDPADTPIVRIGSENVRYNNIVGNDITISERAIDSIATTHIDTSVTNAYTDYLVLDDRLDVKSGKIFIITTDDTLPTPLTVNTNYYATLIELNTILDGNVGLVDTTINVEDVSTWPLTGTVYIGGEYMDYTSRTDTSLDVTRGVSGSTIVVHSDDDRVYLWDRAIYLSVDYEDMINKVYIPITDDGIGVHTLIGEGVEVSLFTGFQIIRPQALLVRSLIAYRTYDDVNEDYTKELDARVDHVFDITPDVTTGTSFVTGSSNGFIDGSGVRFKPLLKTRLALDMDTVVTTVTVDSTASFNATGFILIGDEWIAYSGITATTYTGCSRAQLGTTAQNHTGDLIVQGILYEDTNNNILNFTYYTNVTTVTTFTIHETRQDALDNINAISILNGASSTIDVEMVDVYYPIGGQVVTQDVTGATGIMSPSSGRVIDLQYTAGDFDTTNRLVVTGSGFVDIDGLFSSNGLSSLTQFDFNDLTMEQIENGGTDFAIELSMRYSQIREESPATITKRYWVPTMSDDVQSDSDWTVDSVTPIGSYSQNSLGHITSAQAGGKGILRGFISATRPIIELVTTVDQIYFNDDSGIVTGTIGSDTISGVFSVPLISQNNSFCMDDIYYQVKSGNASSLTFFRDVESTTLLTGDTIITQGFFQNAIWAGTGAGTGTRYHWAEELGYAFGIGNTIELIKMELLSDVSASINWIPDLSGSFTAIDKGHVTQLITGATGIIRSKNTVSDSLTSDITAVDTVIPVDDTSQFPTTGAILIELEEIVYTGKTATTFTGCIRGQHETAEVFHAGSSIVYSSNKPVDNPDEVYIEVLSGTFDDQVTSTITVGNGSTSGNDVRTVSTIEDVSKNKPVDGKIFYVDDTDLTDDNRYVYYTITDSITDNGENIVVFNERFKKPIGALGTFNLSVK